jgi:phenylacetate-CoA ligase
MSYGSAWARSVYYHSPVWAQNLACTAYGYRHNRLWQGQYFRQWYQALQENQWKSTDEVLHLQWLRLRDLLRHAYDNVPFYQQQWRELGLTPGEFKSAEDLRQLPLLDKESLREHAPDFVSRAFRTGDLLVSHTSGTTGKQLTLWVSRESYEREYSFRWHHYSWSGVPLGARRAYLSGHPVVAPDCQSPPFARINHAEKSLLFSSQHLSETHLPHYIKELESFQPEFIEGYPSSVYLLALHMKTRGIRPVRPRGVYVTSETLLDFQRGVIEEAFDCKVFNWYGNTERAGNITGCLHGSLHIQLEHAVVEILDENGRPANDGTDGEIVVTGLGNFAFPLIRYRVGDAATPKRGKCSCGRSGPLVGRITGRVEDYVVSADGRYFGRLDHIFKDTERVREAQIIQDRIDHLVFRVVPRPQFSEEDTSQILLAARERFGSAFQVDIQLTESIERGPNGKFRFIVNRLGTRERSLLAFAREGAGDRQGT